MTLTGNIQRIKSKREDRNQDIVLAIDKIVYVTYKKDGRFYQAFEYIDWLDMPLVITGDCLSRAPNIDFQEEDFAFLVYDKAAESYIIIENKKLVLTLVYVEESEETILHSGTYSVVVPNAEFEQIKRERHKNKKLNKGKNKS